MLSDESPCSINPLDHLGLVQDMVSRYIAPRIDRRDLFQEGFLGLMRAAELYNPSLGRFSTYANYWIRSYISSFAFHRGHIIKIPVSTRSLVRAISKGRLAPQQLTPAENAAITVYNTHTFHEKHGADISCMVLIAGREPCPDDRATSQNTIEHLLRALLPVERDIVVRYFGLDGQPEESCKQIAARRGVTWQRVAQILNRSISRMQLQAGIKAELCIKNTRRKKKDEACP